MNSQLHECLVVITIKTHRRSVNYYLQRFVLVRLETQKLPPIRNAPAIQLTQQQVFHCSI